MAKIIALTADTANSTTAITDEQVNKAIIRVSLEKFIFVNNTVKSDPRIDAILKDNGFDEEHIIYSKADANGTGMTADDVETFVSKVNKRFGGKVAEQGATKTDIVFKEKILKAEVMKV